MQNIPSVRPLSDALSRPIINAYRAGGLALVLIFIGTLLLLAALFFGQGPIGYAIGVLGSLIILVILILFYLQSIRPLQSLNAHLRRNQEVIDTVQQAAIHMTSLAYSLQALAFKNAQLLAKLATKFRRAAGMMATAELIARVPGADRIHEAVESKTVIEVEDLSAAIVDMTEVAEQAINNMRDALIDPDPRKLKEYLTTIEQIDRQLKSLLKNK